MARFFIIAILLVPIIEIAVLIKVGQSIGLLWTLALLIGAGIFGVALLRQQGLSVLNEMRTRVNQGKMPARAVADAMMIGLASVFLIVPGFLSDIVAIALLLPPVRTLIYGAFASRVVVVHGGAGMRPTGPRGPADRPLDGPGTIDLGEDNYRRD